MAIWLIDLAGQKKAFCGEKVDSEANHVQH